MNIPFSRTTATALLLHLLAPASWAQSSDTTGETKLLPQGRLYYIGDSAQMGFGVVSGGGLQGEIAAVLHEGTDSAWLTDAWLLRNAGGVKLSYHRAVGERVYKHFLAVDQNDAADRKWTFGAGLEQGQWFGHAFVSRAVSDARMVGTSTSTTVQRLPGVEDARPFEDTVTRVLTTKIFERAYDHGFGFRVGYFFDDQQVRLSSGLDHDMGSADARQTRLTLLAEKFFAGTPHSLSLQLDHRRRSGDLDGNQEDTRATLSYRYSFGNAKNTQPERLVRMVANAASVAQTPESGAVAPSVIPAHTERKVVVTRATMTSDAFFKISSADLTPVARAELERVAAVLKASRREGNVRIVGHSCDLGPESFNVRLSTRRAAAVRDYLVSLGVFSAHEVVAEGKGSAQPRFPAKHGTRSKNRRVELEFVQLGEEVQLIQIPARTIPGKPATAPAPVTYQQEIVEQEPAWVRRALRTPASHNRSVDVYRTKEEASTESTRRTWINRAPIVQADQYQVASGSTTSLPVLNNDRDADPGDALTLMAVGTPTRGQARVDGGNVVYVAPTNYAGSDSFTYTVRDAQGATATGTVQVTVTQANRAPQAQNDTYYVGASFYTPLPVLENDSDADGDSLSITSVTQPVGGNGTVRIVGNQVHFTPRNPFRVDSFTYTISDGKGGVSTATVELIDP